MAVSLRDLSRWARVTVAAAMLAALGCGTQATPPSALAPTGTAESGPKQSARQAPDFSFTSLDGREVKLADFKGKPLVVNFWASWCPYCAREAPDLEAIHQEHRSEGLEMVGIAANDRAEALKAKARQLRLTYPVGISPGAAGSYGVEPVPHTFFIDREGRIVSSLLGARPREQLEAEVKKIL